MHKQQGGLLLENFKQNSGIFLQFRQKNQEKLSEKVLTGLKTRALSLVRESREL
jgi:hypothetical protein